MIAYSTCSQLGYMFIAAGVGAYQTAMFHLFTHAFFKALLFLGAGSVINAMLHEQDMRKMGALWKPLPVTYAVMLIGTLSITGVGLPGLDLGFSGFYSKDAIIEAAFVAGRTDPWAAFAFVVGVLAAGLTAFYSWRLIFMTFHGHAKWGAGHEAGHGAEHASVDDHAARPHESGATMLVPLIALAVGAAFAGGLFVAHFIGWDAARFWQAAIFHLAGPGGAGAPWSTAPWR